MQAARSAQIPFATIRERRPMTFNEWLQKYDAETEGSMSGGCNYYDSDTGLTDYEQMRADEMQQAWLAGQKEVLPKLQS
jgi:hypothetical protein